MQTPIHPTDFQKLLSSQVICKDHFAQKSKIENICAFPSCHFKKLLCKICLHDDPEHIRQHGKLFKQPTDFAKFLQNENDEFCKIVNESLLNSVQSFEALSNSFCKKDEEILNSIFSDIEKKIITFLQKLRAQILSKIIQKHYYQTNNDFQEFYNEKFKVFEERILNPISLLQKTTDFPSNEFEAMVEQVPNSRLVAIQLNNIKEEKIKSLINHSPFLENVSSDDIMLKLNKSLENYFQKIFEGDPNHKTEPCKPKLRQNLTFDEGSPTKEEGFHLSEGFKEDICSNKINLDSLDEATELLTSKSLPDEELEISLNLPYHERQDKMLDVLSQVLNDLKRKKKKIKIFELNCAANLGRRSLSGGISDEGVFAFINGIKHFSNSIEKLKLDFSYNSAIGDISVKKLLNALEDFGKLSVCNLEFHMNSKITDDSLKELDIIQKFVNLEEFSINFTKTKVNKMLAEMKIRQIKADKKSLKLEIFC